MYTEMAMFFGVIGIIVMAFYTFFPRQTKNLLVRITKRKRYVVCHMRYANTKFEDEFNVVPEADYLTRVGKLFYDLNPVYAIMFWKKRLHYILDENNVIPLHLSKDTNEDVIFQAKEVQNAMNNNVTEYLFTKRKDILIIGLFIVAIVAVIAMIYSIVRMNELLEKINLIGSMIEAAKAGA